MSGPDVILARYSQGAVFAALFAVCLASAVAFWVATGALAYYGGIVIVAAFGCVAYYAWRLIVIVYACAFQDARAIYVRGGAIYGLSLGPIGVAEVCEITIRTNEGGRTVRVLQLNSGRRVSGTVSGLKPSPSAIKRAMEVLGGISA